MGGSVKDIDRGWRALKVELLRLTEKGTVAVGVLGKNAEKQRDGGITNAQLATVHEFGLRIHHPGGTPYVPGGGMMEGTRFVSKAYAAEYANRKGAALPVTKPHEIDVPERSFLRATIDEKGAEYVELIRRGLGRVVDGRMSVERVFGLLGARVAADVRNRIRAGIAPELTAATLRKKTRASDGAVANTPLILTGQLLKAITWAIRGRNDGGEK